MARTVEVPTLCVLHRTVEVPTLCVFTQIIVNTYISTYVRADFCNLDQINAVVVDANLTQN
jgi:hypothetical protein